MDDFLEFFESKADDRGWNLKIYYSSIVDWEIEIGYKATNPKHGENVIHVQDNDRRLAFAKAQVALKEWLLENEGGY